nr:DUF3558 domain-containing protein [uncultured bacterium]
MRVKVAVVVASAALLSGCSENVAGNATPSTSAATDSPSASSDVPKVATPIDTARYEKEPCAALTADQLSMLGITTQPKPDLATTPGPGCEWNAFDEVGLTVDGTLLTAGSSLAGVYQKHEAGAWKFFQPVPDVSGYPGVLFDDKAQPHNFCGMSVAVRDDLIYSMQVTIDPEKKEANDPCSLTRKIAEMAVSTMKAGA